MVQTKYNMEHMVSYLFHNDYTELLLSHTLRSFSLSLFSLFLPVYMYMQGISILSILVFELALFIMGFFFNLVVIRFCGRFGIKKSIIISFLFTLSFYLILLKISFLISLFGQPMSLFILALAGVCGESLYWMSFHLDFVSSVQKEKKGRQLGLLNAMPVLLGIAAPFIGGYSATAFSFDVTLYMVVGFLAVASIPLYFSKELYKEIHLTKSGVLSLDNPSANRVFVIEGMQSATLGLLWPFFMFLVKIQLMIIGALYSFTTFLYAISMYISGKLSDTERKMTVFRSGALLHSFSVMLRPSFQNPAGITLMQSIGGFTAPFILVPLHTMMYARAELNVGDVVLNRELYLHLGRVLVVLPLIILLLSLTPVLAFTICIIVTGVAISSLFWMKSIYRTKAI
ncbi:MFS transporter [Candidatus Woesearchaeota archaeon]|nr:MFS transporter [Candidatus Woesearchaeota archaeon]